MSGSAPERADLLRRLSRAAAAFAAGGDGIRHVPPELRHQVIEWRDRLSSREQTLDREEWMLGLTTLACLEVGCEQTAIHHGIIRLGPR